MTRFAVPQNPKGASEKLEPKLVQAADFIGQLGDPLYARKANALYYEFEEIGMNRQLGYSSPADIIASGTSRFRFKPGKYGFFEATRASRLIASGCRGHM
jgi:hypothetical protein